MNKIFIYKPETTHGAYGHLELKASVEKPVDKKDRRYDDIDCWEEYSAEQEAIRQSITPVSEKLFNDKEFQVELKCKGEFYENEDFIIKDGKAFPVDENEIPEKYKTYTVGEVLKTIEERNTEISDLKQKLNWAKEGLKESDEVFCFLEDVTHGEEGIRISQVRRKISEILKEIDIVTEINPKN